MRTFKKSPDSAGLSPHRVSSRIEEDGDSGRAYGGVAMDRWNVVVLQSESARRKGQSDVRSTSTAAGDKYRLCILPYVLNVEPTVQ